MLSPRSEAVNAKVCRTLRAEAHTLRCASGTIFGREVVPEVCRTSAMSSADAGPGAWRQRRSLSFGKNEREAARAVFARGGNPRDRNAELARDIDGGGCFVLLDDQQLGVQVHQVELEFVGPVSRVQGCGGRTSGDAHERGGHRGTVIEHDRDAVVTTDPLRIERAQRIARELAQRLVRERRATRRAQGCRAGRARFQKLEHSCRRTAHVDDPLVGSQSETG